MTDWTRIEGLAENSGPVGERPDVAVLSRNTGATVVRLSFRAGQSMPDHRTGRPILVFGQDGEIDFTVDGVTSRLGPGVAIHVEPGVGHALVAHTDATVALVVLETPAMQ